MELERARVYFQHALDIDPDYALALSGMATIDSRMASVFAIALSHSASTISAVTVE